MSIYVNSAVTSVSKFSFIGCPWRITHHEQAVSEYLPAAVAVYRATVLVIGPINAAIDEGAVNQDCGSGNICGLTVKLSAP
ncbi:MAG: hypothetical protein PVS2B2_27450 [Candidatus Acidiferrum sp.]